MSRIFTSRTQRFARPGPAVAILLALGCLVLTAVVSIAACASDESPQSSWGSESTVAVGGVAPGASHDAAYYEAEMESTVVGLALINRPLAEANVPLDDPRMAAVYGLRARVQVLMAARALSLRDMVVADSAVEQAHVLLARAVATAKGEEADLLARAKDRLDDAPEPSDDGPAAAGMLDAVIDSLAPLVPSSG